MKELRFYWVRKYMKNSFELYLKMLKMAFESKILLFNY